MGTFTNITSLCPRHRSRVCRFMLQTDRPSYFRIFNNNNIDFFNIAIIKYNIFKLYFSEVEYNSEMCPYTAVCIPLVATYLVFVVKAKL